MDDNERHDIRKFEGITQPILWVAERVQFLHEILSDGTYFKKPLVAEESVKAVCKRTLHDLGSITKELDEHTNIREFYGPETMREFENLIGEAGPKSK